jgi:hypothetical protein
VIADAHRRIHAGRRSPARPGMLSGPCSEHARRPLPTLSDPLGHRYTLNRATTEADGHQRRYGRMGASRGRARCAGAGAVARPLLVSIQPTER